MNILHIDEQRGWRGGEQQASYLIRGTVEQGHGVVLAGRKDSAFLDADHGAPDALRIAAPFKGEIDPVTVLMLARAIRRHAIDIVHAHTSHAHTMASLAARVARRGKVVVSRRVDFVPRSSAINRWKYRLPDHYIAISGCIERVLLEFGVPPDKVTRVYSGIDPGRLDVEPLPRVDLPVPPDAFVFGNVAALVGHKDHLTLVAAMERVALEAPGAHLIIAGEGPLRGAIESAIRQRGLEQRVHLLGHQNAVPRLLKALDVFVMSSKEEGLGTIVLDAMAAGVPVVAAAAGGIPEMMIDGQTGLLAPPQRPDALAEAMIAAMRHPESARQRADAAREHVLQHFTADAMVDGNLRVYETLLQDAAG